MEPNAAKTKSDVLLDVKDLNIRFKTKKGYVNAVEHLDFQVKKGELLALVGESGCGKSVTSLAVMDLIERPGEVKAEHMVLNGKDLTTIPPKVKRKMRGTEMAMIFQDPYSSLDPRMRVFDLIAEPFRANEHLSGEDLHKAVCRLMEVVGLPQEYIGRFPHEFSGGQRQRIGIARALALRPKLIICDEPISALDVSIQAQILNLLVGLQKEFELTYIFISHALPSVKHVSTHVAVMYLGRIVEYAKTEDIFSHPRHPYTEGLMSAVPIPDPSLRDKRPKVILEGDLPSPAAPPPGCHFHTRCRYATEECSKTPPKMCEVEPGHFCACHHPLKDAVGTVLKK